MEFWACQFSKKLKKWNLLLWKYFNMNLCGFEPTLLIEFLCVYKHFLCGINGF